MSVSVIENKKGITKDYTERNIVVDHLPYYYHISIFMPCDQKCIMCVPDGRHPKDMLPFEKFIEFFEKIKPYAEHLTLIGGETLLYPHIEDVIDLLSDHEIAVTIHTNASRLTGALAEKLTTLHELNLRCSIDAATKETYFRIRGRDWFDRVIKNMKEFSDLAKDKTNIKQMINYVVMRENLHEVLPFIDLAKTINPYRVQFGPVRHVMDWVVENGTGWLFKGKDQSCEAFREEYNEVMKEAAEKFTRQNMRYDILYV